MTAIPSNGLWYVGRLRNNTNRMFRSKRTPTSKSHGKIYLSTIGPFKTARGARFMATVGKDNPHCQTVADAEKLSKGHKALMSGGCPGCELMRINGVVTHERGCPYSHVGTKRKCKWCGSSFEPAERHQEFCDESCYRAFNNLPDDSDDMSGGKKPPRKRKRMNPNCPKCGEPVWDTATVDQHLNKCWKCGLKWYPGMAGEGERGRGVGVAWRKTPSIHDIKAAQPAKSYFFSPKTMKFFGQTLKSFGVHWNEEHDCWETRAAMYARGENGGKRRFMGMSVHYWDKDTLVHKVIPTWQKPEGAAMDGAADTAISIGTFKGAKVVLRHTKAYNVTFHRQESFWRYEVDGAPTGQTWDTKEAALANMNTFIKGYFGDSISMDGGRVIRYTPDLKISNMESLPAGSGAPYLECISAHDPSLPLIAKAWRRNIPEQFDVLVEFDHNAPSIRRSAASAWRSRIRPEDSRSMEFRRDARGGVTPVSLDGVSKTNNMAKPVGAHLLSGKGIGDPDREEIAAAVEKWKGERKGLYDFDRREPTTQSRTVYEFDIEEAIYWFANDWHSGQSSNLYSVLSTSQFRPGPLAHGIDKDNMLALDLYEFLTREFSK